MYRGGGTDGGVKISFCARESVYMVGLKSCVVDLTVPWQFLVGRKRELPLSRDRFRTVILCAGGGGACRWQEGPRL